MTIRTALFDLDGTLVDSLEDLADAVNHVRHVFSHPQLTVDSVRLMVGKGAPNLIRQALPQASDDDVSHALTLFLEYNRQHIADKSHLYPGILVTLHALADLSIKMAVITNKNEDLSELLLQSLGIYDLFAFNCGGDTYPERKPSPLPLLKVIDTLGFALNECVMIGDSSNDIQAGQRAGITTIGCSWGYGNRDELVKADMLVHTPQELIAAITSGLDRQI
ncbi:MAG: HAD-IA family hydrolase [Desulfuromonadales bacterium]